MRKKFVKFSTLPAALALIFFSFSTKEKVEHTAQKEVTLTSLTNSTGMLYTVDSIRINYPLLQKDFTGFKAAMGFKESQSDYSRVNVFGYMGKYQFSKHTLALIGVYDTNEFMHSPAIQEAAFKAYVARNKWVLRRYIHQYVGTTIKGVEVTESGILAAAHLAGPGGVKRFLRSAGNSGASDAFGTSIKHYMKRFGGYDLTHIKADRQAKVNLDTLEGQA